MGIGYALEPSRGTALIGGLVGVIAVYYAVQYVVSGSEDDSGSSSNR
ncbi:hypothetical protein OB955_04235 [Halobacteria archaeon AArc-m2/3/4]|uniref:Uncharacterized protein n=1 Tax=Natronoglomus mannanivorans TaxID=2979990 RepID=A0AAP3E2F6_9EURY|nr:hypothetical protein [Halobacteria archaeon AArc-xg1-1]MCU4971945.1 hypothetical protein [Halobacteria archaeon AArc-m2/3/4]